MKIADIHTYKNGNKRVDFFHYGIYDLIRNELNYRFAIIDDKNYYFKFENGTYKKTKFFKIKAAFLEHLKKNFELLEINGEIDYIEFLNAYHRQNPITNCRQAKTMLGEDFKLSEKEIPPLKT